MKRWHIWTGFVVGVVVVVVLVKGLLANEIPVAHWDWPEDRVEIPPYLLELNPDSVVLSWVTPVENLGVVELRSLDGTVTERESAPSRYHKVRLAGLRPSAFYRYRVNDVYEGEFSTPALDNWFRAAVVGHTHGTEHRLQFPEEFLIARMVELNPDLALHCGDTTYHATTEDFRRFFFELFRPALERFPVFVAAGNHDSGWPGVYGISFDNFRRLHPYEYGGDKGAYYSFVYKHVKFIALSYTTLGFGKDSKQYKWLAEELENSTSEFNVVFLGGGQASDNLINELFDFLSSYRVDLVLGGDSAGAFFKQINGIPYFFTGTMFQKPHPLRLIEAHDYNLTIREFDATGMMKPDFHTVNTSRPKDRVVNLMDTKEHPAFFRNKPVGKLSFTGFDSGERVVFPGVDLDSSEFDGIFVKARCQGAREGVLRVYWRSSEMKDAIPRFKQGNEQWDRLQPVRLSTVDELGFALAMPDSDPLNGHPYRLADIALVNASKGCEEEIELTEFYLFRDTD